MTTRALRVALLLVVTAVIAAVGFAVLGGGDDDGGAEEVAAAPRPAPPTPRPPLPPPPEWPTGPIDPATRAAIDAVIDIPVGTRLDEFEALVTAGDPRVAWQLVDQMRVTIGLPAETFASQAVAELVGISQIDARLAMDPDADPERTGLAWADWTDLLLAWDLPATDGYVDDKRTIYEQVDPGFAAFLTDDEELDWRRVTWGGVERDGIATLVDPVVTDADGADWLPDDETILGVVVEGEARAYPQRMLDVHEIAQDTLGGRSIHVTLCTLCGSAVAFDTTDVPGVGPLELRTSGLLESSNKLMFDPASESLLRQFSGDAVTGELLAAGVEVPIIGLTVTSWGAWREAHPATTVLAEDPGTGRTYRPGQLVARDADGPIFPVGDTDLRLPPNSDVLGVIGPDGPIALSVADLDAALADGDRVEAAGLVIAASAAGPIITVDGEVIDPLFSRWFAWAQRHPDTAVWTG
ncbi:MAG: DUF3179 domain-containing (seleno)protein [Actinomycetota bacterium]